MEHYLLTCQVYVWQDQKHMIFGQWFLNGDGTPARHKQDAHKRFGERCDVYDTRIWPTSYTLNQAVAQHTREVTDGTRSKRPADY